MNDTYAIFSFSDFLYQSICCWYSFELHRLVGTYVEVYQDEGPRLDTLLSAVTVDRSKVDLLLTTYVSINKQIKVHEM